MFTYVQKNGTIRVMARCFDDRHTIIMMFMNDLIPKREAKDEHRPSWDNTSDCIYFNRQTIRRGDWIVYDHNGAFTVFSDEGFKDRYEEYL